LFEEKPGLSAESRRNARFRITPLSRVTFETNDGRKYEAFNVSKAGVGLILDSDFKEQRGSDIEGLLHLDQMKIPVTLRVAHRSGNLLGCSIEKPKDTIGQIISDFFKTEITALKLTRVETQKNEALQKEKLVLYRGDRNCELFLREREGRLSSFSITFFGHYLEGTDEGLSVAGEFENHGSTMPKGVSVFRKSVVFDPSVIEGAKWFLDSIKELTKEQKSWLVSVISRKTPLETK